MNNKNIIKKSSRRKSSRRKSSRRKSMSRSVIINKNSISPCNQIYSLSKQIDFLNTLNEEKEGFIEYPVEKIKKIEEIIKYNTSYPNIHSYYQIQTIVNSFKFQKNLEDFKRLIYLIWRHFNMKDFKNLYRILIEKERNDIQYFNLFKKLAYNNKMINKKRNKKFLIEKDVLDITKFIYYKLISKSFRNNYNIDINNFKKYLDLGCGNGRKTIKLGNLLNLKENNIYCADIEEWFSYNEQQRNNENNKNFVLLNILENENLNIKKNSIDIITMIHVLHHMKDYEFRIKNLYNIMKKGGIMIVVEHDAMTTNDFCLADLEHTFYEINDLDKFYKKGEGEFYSNYFNWIEVNILMKENGFKFLRRMQFKRGNVRNIIQPTMTYVSFYQK